MDRTSLLTMCYKHRWLLYCAALLSAAQYSFAKDSASIKVKVNVFGMAEMHDAFVEISGSGERYQCTFSDGLYACNHVPPGKYNLTVSSPGFDIVNGPIEVYSHLIALRVRLRVGGLHSTLTNELRGDLDTTAYGSGPLFISLIPQYWGETSTTTLVSNKGQFLLSGFDYGQFILLISSADKMLCSQFVELTGKKIATGKPTEGNCSLEIKDH